MTDVALLGIRVESSQTEKASRELDQLAISAGRADVSTERLAVTSGRKMAPAMAAGGQQSRMMAQQLSQVAQQASATGNWVQALAIQLPDMALGFGAVGIAAGVLAGATLPLLVSLLGDTSGQAKATEDALSDMAEKTQMAAAAADAARVPTDELAATYGNLAVQAREALQAVSDVALVDAVVATDAAVKSVVESLLLPANDSWEQLAINIGAGREEATRLLSALQGLEAAQGLVEQAQAAASVRDALIATYGSVEKMPAPLRAAYASLAQITIEAAKANTITSRLPEILDSAKRAADSAAGAVAGIGTAASNAYGAVSDLVDKMWEMAAAKAGAEAPGGLARTGEDGRGSQRGTVRGSRTVMPDQPWMNTGAGGGGGGADPYADDLQALLENLQSEREIEEQWYQENLAILQDRRAQEIMGKEAHDAAMVSLHEEYQRRIAEIDAAAQQQRLGDTANLFGALAGIAQAGGQKMAKIAATFQAIEGTVNAYGAAIKALNTPGITLAGRFAAYASVLAAGLKGVAAIRSAGGIGGGGGSGASVASQGATTAGGQNIEYRVYGLERDAVYSGAFIEKIFAGLMEEGKRRGLSTQTVTFV